MLLSGGIDSATALYLTRRAYRVRALTFEYHDIARMELQSARRVGALAGVVEHRFVRLPDLKEAADMGITFRGLPPTYIPMRNAVFYSFAASYAEESGTSLIVGGHNLDDGKVFQDVSAGFFAALQRAFSSGSLTLRKNRVRISRPLKQKSKPQVIRLALALGVPLGLTWSCQRTGGEHCWECDGCLARRRSFERAGVADPLFPGGRGKIT